MSDELPPSSAPEGAAAAGSAPQFTSAQVAAAWGVHLYTALGLVLALLSMEAIAQGDAPAFLLLNLAAIFVDGSDGTLARHFRVKEVVPFDGALLDNIADYITYVFLPALAFVAFGLLPDGWRWVVVFPVLASGYQFCQSIAKTDESFVGFPSYWNLVFLYFYVLQPPSWLTAVVLVVLSIMVFVPFHYVYPSRTRMLKPLTIGLGLLWFGACVAVGLSPEAPWAPQLAVGSLAYIAYYVVLSAVLHMRIKKEQRAAAS